MPTTKAKPAAEASRKPKPTHPPTHELKLTDFQAFVCDLAGTLILRGGHDDDTDNMAFFLCRHYYRTMFPQWGGETSTEADARVEKFAQDAYREWLGKLRHEWPVPDKHPLNVGHPEPKGAVQRVYATLRADLEARMLDFMNEAGADEKYLLRDILMDWESGKSSRADSEEPEVSLATAFMYQINEGHTYFKVPDEIKDLVDGYVRLLLLNNKGSKAATVVALPTAAEA